jgi:hypothetical protein
VTDDAPKEPTSPEIFVSAAKHPNAVTIQTNALGDFNQRVNEIVMQSESFGRPATRGAAGTPRLTARRRFAT